MDLCTVYMVQGFVVVYFGTVNCFVSACQCSEEIQALRFASVSSRELDFRFEPQDATAAAS